MSRHTRLTIHAAVATILASVVLYPLFVTFEWFWPTAFGVVVVAAACLAGRRVSLPAPVCSLLGLAALLWYLTVVFAGSEATFRLIPDRSSMAQLLDLMRLGFDDIGGYTAPVPALTSITFVTVAGIGLVAVLVDLFAAGMRQAALAGLPLLAVFSVPVAIRVDSIGALPFVIGAIGFISLLLAEGRERLSRWGRPVLRHRRGDGSEHRTADIPDSRPLAAAGRRIGMVAVLVAVVFPMLVPELPARAFLGTGGLGGFGGTSIITAPSPMVSLKRDLTLPQELKVMRYRTKDQTPEYLRIYALERFTGERWELGRVRGRPEDRVVGQQITPPGLGDVPTTPVTTEVSIDPKVRDLNFLPLPYPPSRVQIVDGDWRVDRDSLMIFSTRDVASGRTYRVTSLRVDPSRERLRNAPPGPAEIRERHLDVPGEVPGSVWKLAREVTDDASTPYGKALALQDWFTSGEFTYSLTPQGSGTSALTDFLLKSKSGYCEQYAASMALMARMLNIPARVAVGYTAGQRAANGEWMVTTHDAHAWPELYFHGVGWLRFEPTPAGPGGQATATIPGYSEELVTPGPATGSISPDSQTGSTDESDATANPNDDPASGIDGGAQNLGGGTSAIDESSRPWSLLALTAGVLAVVLLVTPMVGRWITRRRRWAAARSDRARARAAWAELRDDATDLGLPWRPSDSPRATARRLAEHLELAGRNAAPLTRIALAEERARYAPTPAETGGLKADTGAARRAMAGTAGASARWKARLFPASTVASIRRAAQGIGGLLARVDGLGRHVRARLLRQPAASSLARWLGGGT
ncbi:MAG: transglutaminase [Streptosporangiales bacterium]|nr:transglutaminase [Streptosporangiales bacterium]